MTPKLKLNLLLILAMAVVIISAVMLKQNANASNMVKLGWGMILAMGGMTLARGFRLYKQIK
jgi:hypothetical protein